MPPTTALQRISVLKQELEATTAALEHQIKTVNVRWAPVSCCWRCPHTIRASIPCAGCAQTMEERIRLMVQRAREEERQIVNEQWMATTAELRRNHDAMEKDLAAERQKNKELEEVRGAMYMWLCVCVCARSWLLWIAAVSLAQRRS